jgi:hypothetical protein
VNTFVQPQAQTQAYMSLTEKQIRGYFTSERHTRAASWIAAIGLGLMLAGGYFLLAGLLPNLVWLSVILMIVGICALLAGGAYWYYLTQSTPTDEDYKAHMQALESTLYYKALHKLGIQQPDHFDCLVIQSYVLPGTQEARMYNIQDLLVKECANHLRSSFCKYVFIFVNATFIGIYEGYADGLERLTFGGETARQYRATNILSIEAIHNTTTVPIKLDNTIYRYQQEAMVLELVNGRRISITVYASPPHPDLPTYFATSRRYADHVYNTISKWFQQ